MSKRIETEKKYYCCDSKELLEKINIFKFNLESTRNEIDEYFTDINSVYIKNRTCLRIRTIDNKEMEITFKGKSSELSNVYSKLESNFNLNIDNYNSIVSLFNALGYYSYTVVNKNRRTYSISDQDYQYSIMIDLIENIGGFVEFELLCYKEDYDENTLKNKLDKFINKFSSLNLEEAKLPYRDFVAINEYNTLLPDNPKGIHINFDSVLIDIEKNFYSFYKKAVKETSEEIIKWGRFKRMDILEDLIINPELNIRIEKYFETLKIKDNNLELLSMLLTQLKKHNSIVFSTKCSKLFINLFLGRIISFNIFDSVIYLKSRESIYSELKKHKINLCNYYSIMNKSFKETNSLLLIIINNIK